VSLNSKSLIALAFGIVSGMLVQTLASESVVDVVFGVEGLGMIWVNALAMVVLPLAAFGVAAAIGETADPGYLRRIGLTSVPLYVVLLFAAGVVTVIIGPLFLGLIPVDGWVGPSPTQRAVGLGTVATGVAPTSVWVGTLVPGNAVAAAVTGAMFPLLVFSLALGVAITRISEQSRATLVGILGTVTNALLGVAGMVFRLAPVCLFALGIGLGVRLGVGAVGAAAVYAVLVLMVCAVLGLLLYPVATTFGNVSWRAFVKACAAAQMTALASRSSRATVPVMIRAAEDELGMTRGLARTILPLGESFFSMSAVVRQAAGALVLAHLYHVEVSSFMLLSLVATSVAVSFRSLGVPEGTSLYMAPFYLAMGIPPEGIGVIVGIDTIPQTLGSALNVTAHMTVATVAGRARPAGP
jgi:Na+/H+-dicarboxylate symporter